MQDPQSRYAVDNHVALLGQGFQGLGGAGGAVAELGGVDDLVRAVVVDEDFLQLVEEGVGVVLAVFEEADGLAAEAGEVGVEALLLGYVFGGGVENLDGVGHGFLLCQWPGDGGLAPCGFPLSRE